MDERKKKILSDLYYRDGHLYGRDALFQLVSRKYPKSHPTKEEVGEWLGQQKLNQLYRQTRRGGVVNSHAPTTPFNQISIDLIDFFFKPARQYRYIFVLIDTFSRYVYTEKMASKKADATAKAFEAILSKIKAEQRNPNIKSCLCDDGSELKSSTLAVFEKHGIRKIRSLGGHPESQGLVERSNGKIKMLLSKYKDVYGGSWADNLEKCTANYNAQYNRGIKYAPMGAVKFTTKEKQKELRGNTIEAYRPEKGDNFNNISKFKVGDTVRIKLNKGRLDKSSTPSWSATLFKVGHIVKAVATTAEKYKITGRAQDQSYSRNDLQLVTGVPEEIPDIKKKPTTRADRKRNELTEGAMTRSRASPPTLRPRPIKLPPKRAPSRRKKGPPKKKGEVELFIPGGIEKSRDGKSGLEYYIKWQGHPASQNTWEPEASLREALSAKDIKMLINHSAFKKIVNQ